MTATEILELVYRWLPFGFFCDLTIHSVIVWWRS